jgi:hypothetical protein
MPTQLLATNTTAASSGDFTVAVGEALTVSLKDAAGPRVGPGARVEIQLKDDAGEYFTVDTLTLGKQAVVIVGPGTYRATRFAGVSCGVFSG